MSQVLETPRRFSASRFWTLMRDYYQSRGPAAWSDGEIPFRISSNAMIAGCYAGLVVGFLRDRSAAGDQRPVTVLELGSGSGRFGFLFAKALAREVEGLVGLPPVRILLSDGADSNVGAWRRIPQMAELMDSGFVDATVLEVGDPDAARLRDGTPLAARLSEGPVVVIANYLLDVLRHDAFRVGGGDLSEVQVGLRLKEASGRAASSQALHLFQRMAFVEKPTPCAAAPYGRQDFDAILAECAEAWREETTFLFPVEGLRGLSWLCEAAGGALMMIVSDMARLYDMEGRSGLSMALNGAYATKVNLDAYARWIRRRGGLVLAPDAPESRFDTYGFLVAAPDARHETVHAYRRLIADAGPARYWRVRRAWRDQIDKSSVQPDLATALAWLALSNYDPAEFVGLARSLLPSPGVSPSDRRALEAAVERVWENYLPIGDAQDPAHLIGRILRRLGHPARALFFFEVSERDHGPHAATSWAMARCHEALGDAPAAIARYKAAAEASRSRRDAANAAVARLSDVGI